jgi:hypothetical protein
MTSAERSARRREIMNANPRLYAHMRNTLNRINRTRNPENKAQLRLRFVMAVRPHFPGLLAINYRKSWEKLYQAYSSVRNNRNRRANRNRSVTVNSPRRVMIGSNSVVVINPGSGNHLNKEHIV